MAYSEFTLRDAALRLSLTLTDFDDLFPGVPEWAPSPLLQAILQESLPLALAINTEKARSELIIAPLLMDLRAQLRHAVSLFSGIEFNVNEKLGLAGYCDYILSRSPEQQFLLSPVAAIVEAKNENIKSGLGQCMAAMLGARYFNEREGGDVNVVYGAVTSGTAWRFLRMDGSMVALDQKEYYIAQIPQLLGVLRGIWTGEGLA